MEVEYCTEKKKQTLINKDLISPSAIHNVQPWGRYLPKQIFLIYKMGIIRHTSHSCCKGQQWLGEGG